DDDGAVNAQGQQQLGGAAAGVLHEHGRAEPDLRRSAVEFADLSARQIRVLVAFHTVGALNGKQRHDFARFCWTTAMYCFAKSRMRPKSRFATASGSTSWLPTPRQHAPAFRNAAAVVRSTPPVGIKRICGNGPRMALKNAGPTMSAGKTLTMSAPASHEIGRAR